MSARSTSNQRDKGGHTPLLQRIRRFEKGVFQRLLMIDVQTLPGRLLCHSVALS